METELLQRFLTGTPHLLSGPARQRAAIEQMRPDRGHLREAWLLFAVANPRGPRNAAGIGQAKAGYALGECRLARAVRAAQPEPLTVSEFQMEPLEHAPPTARKVEVGEVEAEGVVHRVMRSQNSLMLRLSRLSDGTTRPPLDGMVFGRLSACDWVLEDHSVSRRHARLEQRGAGWWVVDLGSSNGISLNGVRVDEGELHAGDRLSLGGVEFVVEGSSRVGETPTQPTPSEPTAPAAEQFLTESDHRRSRLHAALRQKPTRRRLGDLDQQPFWIKLVVTVFALGLAYGVYLGVRYLGQMIAGG